MDEPNSPGTEKSASADTKKSKFVPERWFERFDAEVRLALELGRRPPIAELFSQMPPEELANLLPKIIEQYRELRLEYGKSVEFTQIMSDHPELVELPAFVAAVEQSTATLLRGGTMVNSPDFSTEPLSQSMDDERILPSDEGYSLRERLGKGGSGTVWRAIAPGGVEVAVKCVFGTADQASATTEARALELIRELRHPYLLQVHAYWTMPDRLVIVTELADGNLAESKFPEGPEGDRLFVQWLREAAEAIDVLHEHGILHRDIKPENLMVQRGHLKVGDFGIARSKKAMVPTDTFFAGTPSYMAPEMWIRHALAESDQYALALSFLCMRLGRRVFDSDSMFGMMQLQRETMPSLEPLSEQEQKAWQRALAKDPTQRYPNCKALAEAVAEAILPQPKPVSKGLRMVLAASLLCVAALGGWTLYTQLFAPPNQIAKLEPQLVMPDSVELAAGSSVVVPIALNNLGDRQAGLRIGNTPDGMNAKLEETGEDATPTFARIAVDLNKPSGDYELIFSAWFQDGTEEPFARRKLRIAVVPPTVRLPKGFQRTDGAKLVALPTGVYFDRIEHKLPSGLPVVFLLVSKQGESWPATFYMTRDKITNRQFAEFAAAKPESISKDSAWKKGGIAGERDVGISQLDHPVFRVSLEEANAFAQWVGGKLPSAAQWDAAAGIHLKNDAPGPFKGIRDPSDGGIAVKRELDGPMNVGAAIRDENSFGFRDLSGNGKEWTRTEMGAPVERELPLKPADPTAIFFLRGRSYLSSEPLLYQHLRDPDGNWVESETYLKAQPYISFRVVVEP